MFDIYIIYICVCVCVIGLNIISTKCLPYLRVACACLLRANNDAFLATFALKCSSFCQMNTATSKRTPCSSTGYSEYQSVRYSNTLAERRSTGFYNETKQRSSPPYSDVYSSSGPARTVLLIYLTTCLGGAWFLEQPRGSSFEYYPAFRKMMMDLRTVANGTAATCPNFDCILKEVFILHFKSHICWV